MITPTQSPAPPFEIILAAAPPDTSLASPSAPAPSSQGGIFRRLLRLLVPLILLSIAGFSFYFFIILPGHHEHLFSSKAAAPAAPKKPLDVELVEGTEDTLAVPKPVRKALGIKGTAIARVPTHGRPLVMPGSTALDPTRLMRVRTRFTAEVMEVGKAYQPADLAKTGEYRMPLDRELRAGDKVKKGDVLAVVWSVDVGGKKSDLVDALVQMRLDEQRLKAREKLYRDGNIPEDTLNQTRRDVISGKNAVERAERTLRTWNVPDKEIATAREEAEAAVLRKGKRDVVKERLWARSEIVAPSTGTIVERNVGVGEYVADNTVNLFMIADVSRMLVMVNPPEDYLPILLGLGEEQRRWSLQTVGAGRIEGRIDEIGYILDPSQHTAVVKGHIDNPQGRLRAGQFVSATVTLPPPPDVVEVPINSLVEDGRVSFLFIQTRPGKHEYKLKRVLVTHRFENIAFVRSKLTAAERKRTPQEIARNIPPCSPLLPGERFLESGVLELRAALEDLLLTNKKDR